MKSLVLAIGFVLATNGASAQTYFADGMSDGYLNMRAGPGTSHAITTRIFPGDQVTFLEERGNWLRVRLANGEIGWGYEKYLIPITSFSGQMLKVQPTSDGFLNLREGPSTKTAVKEKLHTGTTVVLVKRQGNWFRVRRADGPLGWAHSKYLK